MASKQMPVGTKKQNPNGYWRIKTEDGSWRFLHHVNIEKELGRPLGAGERVTFKDGDRGNCDPNNLVVRLVGNTSPGKRRAHLEAKLQEIVAELEHLGVTVEYTLLEEAKAS